MDFLLTEEQTAISDLAGQILTEMLPVERLREIEGKGEWFAADAWQELAKADLLGVCLPEADGGGGFGILEACLILDRVGQSVAPLPFLASVVMGAMPIAEFGTPAQRAALLPGAIDGSLILTAALVEDGDGLPPELPTTRAVATGDGWQLHGEKVFVPAAEQARRILVPALLGDGTVQVFIVDPEADGVSIDRMVMTNLEPMGTLRLDGVAASADDVLGSPGADGSAIVKWITDRAVAGICATQSGVCTQALKITATYTSERKQFNAPIATFQAVAQRAADGYVDTEGVRLTAQQAAWRLAEGLPADDALSVAKFWSAEGAQRVVHAAQHLHGGIGVDVDYPIHRYFRWAKHLELQMGGGTRHLLRLGRQLAAEPV